LGRLFDRHAAVLVLLARQWCDAPEDVVQEAFLKLSTVRTNPDRPAAWLYRVVRNVAISAGRSRQRRQHHEHRAAATEWFEADAGEKIDSDRAAELLARLPSPERDIIIAHVWGGLTFEEVAESLDLSSSTAHRLFVKGLEELRRQLGESHANFG
jgi:RNA polymerase sigma factor (sigma-70 family)